MEPHTYKVHNIFHVYNISAKLVTNKRSVYELKLSVSTIPQKAQDTLREVTQKSTLKVVLFIFKDP